MNQLSNDKFTPKDDPLRHQIHIFRKFYTTLQHEHVGHLHPWVLQLIKRLKGRLT